MFWGSYIRLCLINVQHFEALSELYLAGKKWKTWHINKHEFKLKTQYLYKRKNKVSSRFNER